MKKNNFVSFNIFSFIVFIVIALNSIGFIGSTLSKAKENVLLITLSFSLIGILIQFFFILKKLSK